VERVGEVVKRGAFADAKQTLEGVGNACIRVLNEVVKPTVLGAQAVLSAGASGVRIRVMWFRLGRAECC
jgi:hypothetical protein